MSTAEYAGKEPLAWLPNEWAEFLRERGERPFRAMQIFQWIHRRGVADPERMSNLNSSLRTAIAAAGLAFPTEIIDLRRASDGTRKGLVRMRDGASVETVLIPPHSKDDVEHADDDADAADGEADKTSTMRGRAESAEYPRVAARRVTQCISSQVGCAMACVFCASGVAGLKRNMTAAEIVSQVLLGRQALDADEALRGVVLMGMGEPLHNYGNVERALRLMIHPDGIDLSSRRVTVSTSGLIPEIERLGKDFKGQIALAISLHAPDDDLRTSLMPINKRYPLAELIAALKRYPLPPRRRITIEYTLIEGMNDGEREARGLARVLRGVPVKINLIPMNPIAESDFRMPGDARVDAFQDVLRASGYSVFVRRQRGDDIDAACGQLALKGANPKKRRLPVAKPRGVPHA